MKTLTVWHGGIGRLCRPEIALMRRLDTRGAIRFVDATTADMASCPADRRDLLARFQARENDELLSRAATFAAMRAITVLRPLELLARSPMALALLERACVGFLKVRPGFQRLASGLLPS
jgi:predicted DCC family thiol-disulfide oxidoreductase YuxK